MSGGNMEYLYLKVDDAEFNEDTHLRKIFREHLKLVSRALHDIEWVDSCDYSRGDEDKAILACLNHDPRAYISKILSEEIKEKQEQLKRL